MHFITHQAQHLHTLKRKQEVSTNSRLHADICKMKQRLGWTQMLGEIACHTNQINLYQTNAAADEDMKDATDAKYQTGPHHVSSIKNKETSTALQQC